MVGEKIHSDTRNNTYTKFKSRNLGNGLEVMEKKMV